MIEPMRTAAARFAVLAASTASVGFGACAHGGDAPIANRGKPGPEGDVRAIDWQNRTYDLGPLGAVTVKDGQADFAISDDNKVAEAGTEHASYAVDPPLFADIDGDGAVDAVISSVLSTGGTGHFSDVRIYTLRAKQLVELAVIPGGDRGDGGIRRVALDGNAVIVERNVLAGGDGLCCASSFQRERWVWRHGELVEDEAARRALSP